MECIECKKSPHELSEYIEAAKEEDMEIEEYVRQEEGTYNRFAKGKFYCTMCYIKVGMPLYR
jgi:hypothetical protein